jgi:hypothetical protein
VLACLRKHYRTFDPISLACGREYVAPPECGIGNGQRTTAGVDLHLGDPRCRQRAAGCIELRADEQSGADQRRPLSECVPAIHAQRVSAIHTQGVSAIHTQGVSAILFAQGMTAIHDAAHSVWARVWALSV